VPRTPCRRQRCLEAALHVGIPVGRARQGGYRRADTGCAREVTHDVSRGTREVRRGESWWRGGRGHAVGCTRTRGAWAQKRVAHSDAEASVDLCHRATAPAGTGCFGFAWNARWCLVGTVSAASKQSTQTAVRAQIQSLPGAGRAVSRVLLRRHRRAGRTLLGPRPPAAAGMVRTSAGSSRRRRSRGCARPSRGCRCDGRANGGRGVVIGWNIVGTGLLGPGWRDRGPTLISGRSRSLCAVSQVEQVQSRR
jgi:hypothetical protein